MGPPYIGPPRKPSLLWGDWFQWSGLEGLLVIMVIAFLIILFALILPMLFWVPDAPF